MGRRPDQAFDMDDLLREMMAAKRGTVTLPSPAGEAEKPHRERHRNAAKLVRIGYAAWSDHRQASLRITLAGRRYAADNCRISPK